MGTTGNVEGIGEPVWMMTGWEEVVLALLEGGEAFIVMVLPAPCEN